MNKRPHRLMFAIISLLGFGLASHPGRLEAQAGDAYAPASGGTRELVLTSGIRIKLLLEAANLGSDDLEVAEITFPAGINPTAGHRHGTIEVFYVVEGVLDHVVNGVSHRLEPGMVGVVRSGDEVIHRVLSDDPVKVVAIWVPGGEADRIAPPERWTPLMAGISQAAAAALRSLKEHFLNGR